MKLLQYLFVSFVLLSSGMAGAADEIVSFDSPAQSEMYHNLLREYRCLKCQNQNLADSNAGLATDLRREIRDQILAGRNASDIDEYLVSRYGEFVRYRPRFTVKTAVLWIAPFVLMALALSCLIVMIRRRSKQPLRASLASNSGSDEQELELRLKKARQLLDE